MFARWMRIIICAILMIAIVGSTVGAEAAGNIRIIVKLRPGALLGPILTLLGADVLDSIPSVNLYLLRVPLLPALNLTLSLLGVLYIETDTTLDNPTFRNLGLLTSIAPPDFYRLQPSLTLIRADAAGEYYTGYGVVVADINSATDSSHPALQGHLTGGFDFVQAQGPTYALLNQSVSNFLDQTSSSFLDQSSAPSIDPATAGFLTQTASNFLDDGLAAGLITGPNVAYGHGTMVAGLIAAVAPRAMIMPLRVFDDNGRADVFTITKATYYAVSQGAQVINMSFGMNTRSRSVQDAITAAINANVTVTASAGNANSEAPQYPAAYSSVISVGATDLADKKAKFSNFGTALDVTAPGVNILSAYPGGYYVIASGTSFSAPIAAGEAALVRSKQATGVRDAVVNGTINIDMLNLAYYGKLGKGRIDAMKAIGQ
jgi:subtilisin family serine protease